MIGVILLGAPCCGKSTIGKNAAKHMHIQYISSGDIARNMASTNPSVSSDLIAGKLAPEDFMRQAVYEHIKDKELFILDGFPRFEDQYIWLKENLKDHKFIFIHIDTQFDQLVIRSKSRNRDDDNSFAVRFDFYINNTLPMMQRIFNDNANTCYTIENTDTDPIAGWSDCLIENIIDREV